MYVTSHAETVSADNFQKRLQKSKQSKWQFIIQYQIAEPNGRAIKLYQVVQKPCIILFHKIYLVGIKDNLGS
jgi:hypothetical protein